MRVIRIGELLVEDGALTDEQCDWIEAFQHANGGAFGQIAEAHFGIGPDAVERAWARQMGMLAEHVDPRHTAIAPDLLRLIDRRQAWQFGVLPLQDTRGELVLCTTEDRLPRALRFASWRLGHPTSFVLSDEHALSEALAILYPMAGLQHL